MAFSAFLDTCALYPAYLCDTLLRLAEADSHRPLWSNDVLIELHRNLLDSGAAPHSVDHRLDQMRRSFPDALTTGYESLVDGMTPSRGATLRSRSTSTSSVAAATPVPSG